MQFNFNVNDILKSSIEIIDNKSNLDYYGYSVDSKSVRNLQNSQKLSYIIDEMGKASKLAQNLPVVITTSSKLKNSEHRLYISKSNSSNNNNGEVVGLLKVGSKKLFLYDIMGNHYEITPICILDFYIHESKQRQGYGKEIFEFMLKNENLKPYNLAIDRPSIKFLSFLAKHYQLTEPIPQSNNFVVFQKFFSDLPNFKARNFKNTIIYRQPSPFCMRSSAVQKQQLHAKVINDISEARKAIATIPISIYSSPERSRPISCSDKDKVNVERENIPVKTSTPCSDPPLLPRGDTARQNMLYVKQFGNGTPFVQGSNNNHRIQFTMIDQQNCNDQTVSETLPKLNTSPENRCNNDRRTNYDIKQPMKINNIFHSKADYNYSLGLARHYAHNRIW